MGDQRRGPGEEASPRQRQGTTRLPRQPHGEPWPAAPAGPSARSDTLEVVEKPWEGWDLRFAISEAARSGDVVVRLEDAVMVRGDFTLGPFTLDIAWAERVALVGPNGSGKTTLVEAVLGRLPLAAGTRRLGPSVVVGELAQDRRILGDRPQSGRCLHGCNGPSPRPGPIAARQVRARRRCGRSAPASTLSPGERTRAELAAFAALGVNLLVLDEPTNHLDLPAIEQLESALRAYGGTLLLVSHDRRLLEAVTTTCRVELPGRDDPSRGLRKS